MHKQDRIQRGRCVGNTKHGLGETGLDWSGMLQRRYERVIILLVDDPWHRLKGGRGGGVYFGHWMGSRI